MVSGVFFDTTVLVGSLVDAGPSSIPCRRILAAVAHGKLPEAKTAWHCCLELYSVLTRLPLEYRVSPEMAGALLESQVLPRFQIVCLPEDRFRGFIQESAREGIRGGLIYASHIGDIARLSGARVVVTGNRRHFASLLPYGIRVLTPEEFVAGWDERP